MKSGPYVRPILKELLSFDIFTEVSNTKFHENPSSRQTDRWTDTDDEVKQALFATLRTRLQIGKLFQFENVPQYVKLS